MRREGGARATRGGSGAEAASAALDPALARVRRLGIFGGSFDPPHTGHLFAARRAQAAQALDHVLFVPAARPPHKPERVLAPAADRLALLRLLLQGEPGVSIWTGELERGGPSYSIDTLRALRRALGPEPELFWILGSDNLPGLAGWREAEALLAEVQPVIVYRRGEALDPAFLSRLSPGARERVRRGFLPGEPWDASASELRERLSRGELDDARLPPKLREYIRAKGIYAPA